MKPSKKFILLTVVVHLLSCVSATLYGEHFDRILILGTVDLDPVFRYQFAATGNKIYVRKIIHPGGSQWSYWVSDLNAEDALFLKSICGAKGKNLPFPPPGPLVQLKLCDSEKSIPRYHDSRSASQFKDRLMSIIGSVTEPKAGFKKKWPKEIMKYLNEHLAPPRPVSPA